MNEVPMMVFWIQGNQVADVDFSVIPFQTRFVRVEQVAEPGTGRIMDQEVEEWHTHQVDMGEGPRAAEMMYKRIIQAKGQGARKWKEKGWNIIIDCRNRRNSYILSDDAWKLRR
jgi:hypothetical protein